MSTPRTATRLALATYTLLSLINCAPAPKSIGPAYVSSAEYQAYTCPQLEHERIALGVREAELQTSMTRRRDRDAAYLGAGLAAAVPALLLMKGHNPAEEVEYAHVQGARVAVSQAFNEKRCGGEDFRRAMEDTLARYPTILPSTELRQEERRSPHM